MWGTVFVVAVVAACDPVRLGLALLVISRRRPVRNLAAYWVGAVTTGIASTLGVLTLLRHFAPEFTDNLAVAAASSGGRTFQVVLGVVVVLVAASIAVGFSPRALLRRSSGSSDGVPLAQKGPTVLPWLPSRARDVLQGESLWVAVVGGLGSGPPPQETALLVTAILASGAALGTQVSAALVFIAVMLLMVEIPLVTHLFAPARTEAALVRVSGWVALHRRRILAAVLSLAGVWLMAMGIGAV